MTESDIWSQIISSLSCFTCPCSFLKPTPSCGLWIPYPLHQQRPCPWIVLFLLCHQCLLCWICNQHRNVLENVTASSGKSKVTNDFQVAKSTAFFFFSHLYLHLLPFLLCYYYFNFFYLEENCFTMLRWFLPDNTNQPWWYVYPLLRETPSPPLNPPL